ncbi:MAG: TlpA family protein disulfide reductase [Planctomycetes bacterium]|nr:TlpA family protein disulfide reductase [Planctomycetota bacterium]
MRILWHSQKRFALNINGLILAGLAALLLPGCGGGDDSGEGSGEPATTPESEQGSPGDDESGSQTSTGQSGLLNASIPGPGSEQLAEEEIKIERPQDGSPEALILKITQLRLQPFETLVDPEAPPTKEEVEKQRAARRERNLAIIELAQQAIAMTHREPAKEQVFNISVHRLMDATFQLAMQGDQDSIDQLYAHAESLYTRDPKSKAASEAAWFVARYSNENAQKYADQDIRWVQEFSRQSRAFAEKFPHEQQRAVGLLHEASTSADFWNLRDEAIQSYTALAQKFPGTPQGKQAAAPLRRLALIGKKLDLGGPTLDGGFLQVADFAGSPVLIVFWSSQAKPFVDQLPKVMPIVSRHEKIGLQVIGVNLDLAEPDLDAFLEKTGLGWRTIFHQDQSRRGWSHPVAAYYGVRNIPQFWLVDKAGTVVSTTAQAQTLDAELTKLMQK